MRENDLRGVLGEEEALFLSFAKKMLKWKPEERSGAKELLDDPWLIMNRRLTMTS